MTTKERLARFVAEAGVPAEGQPLYQQFAYEFYRTLRRRPVPDFAPATKRVVLRWFNRGLSGRALAAIGFRIIAWLYPPSPGRPG